MPEIFVYSSEVLLERERIGRPDCRLVGQDGNAYAIMGRVSRALKKAGYSKQAIDEYTNDSMAGTYEHLLSVAMAWTEDVGEEEYCSGCGEPMDFCCCEEEDI